LFLFLFSVFVFIIIFFLIFRFLYCFFVSTSCEEKRNASNSQLFQFASVVVFLTLAMEETVLTNNKKRTRTIRKTW
jgi:hypothetical protein